MLVRFRQGNHLINIAVILSLSHRWQCILLQEVYRHLPPFPDAAFVGRCHFTKFTVTLPLLMARPSEVLVPRGLSWPSSTSFQTRWSRIHRVFPSPPDASVDGASFHGPPLPSEAATSFTSQDLSCSSCSPSHSHSGDFSLLPNIAADDVYHFRWSVIRLPPPAIGAASRIPRGQPILSLITSQTPEVPRETETKKSERLTLVWDENFLHPRVT